MGGGDDRKSDDSIWAKSLKNSGGVDRTIRGRESKK